MTRLQKILFIGMPLAVAGAVVAATFPEMRRYLKMRRM